MISTYLFTIFATAWGIAMMSALAIKLYLDGRKAKAKINDIWKESYGKE